MALPATIYRVAIELSDVDRNYYTHLATTVARHPSETAERLVARLIAYALSHNEQLVFTKGICDGDEPDLWTKSLDGQLIDWIEVGLPEAKRLVKAGKHSEQVVLFAYGSSFERWLEASRKQLLTMKNLQLFFLSAELLNFLVAQLQRSVEWQFTRSDKTLYITCATESIVAELLEIDIH
ncbi:MAG: YaeQ family protein [Desulfuromonas sp.]|nr:YaeQ family protein [Desulfuromonas sp.]